MSIQGPSPVDSAIRSVSGAAGKVLAGIFGLTARLRRGKPLHPRGAVARATLAIRPGPRPSGVALLDEPGEHACVVRASYAMGTGPRWSDIEGFALRVLPGTRHTQPVDLLFASTGAGPLSRYTLVLRGPGVHGSQTTLLPVLAGQHPLRLRLEPVGHATEPWPERYELSWAHARGPWRYCGDLSVVWSDTADTADTADAPARFDPVVNPLPGTRQYPVVERLREPSYARARRAWPRAGRLPDGRDPG
jgi:hypothetical protein